MKKFILVLAMLCMLGAAFFGVLNKNFLQELKDDLADTKEEVRKVTEELGKKEDERDGLREEESQAKDERNLASAAVAQVQDDLKRVQRKVDEAKEGLEKIEIEKREHEMIIKRVFPDGNIQTPDELRMILTMLQDTLMTNQNQNKTLDMELAKVMQAKQVQIERVGDEETHQLRRAQKISLSGLEATVVAVNKEWGFIIVNAGRAHGVEPDASLLVKRGNVHIARLHIMSLAENICVCDLVKGSSRRGLSVNPGDKVIFENIFN